MFQDINLLMFEKTGKTGAMTGTIFLEIISWN